MAVSELTFDRQELSSNITRKPLITRRKYVGSQVCSMSSKMTRGTHRPPPPRSSALMHPRQKLCWNHTHEWTLNLNILFEYCSGYNTHLIRKIYMIELKLDTFYSFRGPCCTILFFFFPFLKLFWMIKYKFKHSDFCTGCFRQLARNKQNKHLSVKNKTEIETSRLAIWDWIFFHPCA